MYRAKDCRVTHGSVVDRDAVDDGDREEQTARIDLGEHGLMLRLRGFRTHIVVQHDRIIAIATLHFRANYRRDLLRRP